MAWATGCAEWSDSRADNGYRSIDQDARASRSDIAPRTAGTTGRADAGSDSYAISGDPTNGQTRTGTTTSAGRAYTGADAGSDSYAISGDPTSRQTRTGAATTTSGTTYAGRGDSRGMTTTSSGRSSGYGASDGTGSYTFGGYPQGLEDRSGTARWDRTRGGTGSDTAGSYTFGGGDTQQSHSGAADGVTRSSTQTGMTGRDAQSGNTWPTDTTSSSSGERTRYDSTSRGGETTRAGEPGATKLNQEGEVKEKYLTGEVHDHELDTRTTPAPGSTTTTTGRAGAAASTGAATGAAVGSRSNEARTSDQRTGQTPEGWTDGRSGHETTATPMTGRDMTNRDMQDTRNMQGTQDMRDRDMAARGTTTRTTDSRDSEEDPYGVSPDAYGSSPWSPANRGVRIVRYDRRGIEPLHRETSWQEPGYATTTTAWPPQQPDRMNDGSQNWAQNQAVNPATDRTRDQQGWAQNQPSARPSDRPIDNDAAQRMAGHEPDALAAQPGRDGVTQVDPTLVGISPDARILSVLNLKDQQEVEMGRLAQRKGASADVRAYGQQLERDHSDHARQLQSIASSQSITLLDADKVKEMMKREKDKMKADADGYQGRHDYNQSTDDRRDAGQPARTDRPDQDMPATNPADKDLSDKDRADRDMKDHKDHAQQVAELEKLSGSEFDRRFAEVMLKGHRELIQKVEKCREDVTPQVGQFLDKTLETLRKHEQTAQRLTSMR